ncbi:carbohydrate ABC transporter permease [Nakamurella antarctica]|uniref:Carbohydrate ABC transporter permease n=1 Tax=Nakamurella antarctica TaxID=1902245 RepID=A0A3G8ZX10_9ACTN|nr:carbohydrate ABC transporter permease [Nakamurella antarctica]AZI58566.1 carbohydrate ABC transporter permease [Nakamurella antarctica]
MSKATRAPRPQRRADRPLSASNVWATVLGGYIPLILATFVIIAPLLWMVLSSFKQPSEIVTTDIVVLPGSFDPANYIQAAHQIPFLRMLLNSTIVTVIGASIKLLLAISTAYALVFVRFPFKRTIFVAILIALMVPPQVALLPNYVLIANLGGLNTYWGIIVPGLGTAFGTFLLRQHFLALPMSVIEAAELDGAGHWRRLTSVVIPISMPTIATVALVSIVNEWNDYIWPLIITTDSSMMTLPVGLTMLRNSESGADSYGVLMAGAVMVILPVLIVFAALQRYIVAGLTQGANTG